MEYKIRDPKFKFSHSSNLDSPRNEKGYAYIMVLVAVAVLAILAEVAYVLTSYAVKHDKEEELLFRGSAYEQAIQDYYHSNLPGTAATYPKNLEDLLSDPRYLSKRHIRSLYKDPMGGDWTIVRASDGGIAGVASQSREKPIKQGNFAPLFTNFDGAQHYSDWIFLYNPSGPVSGSPHSTTSPSSE